MLSLNVDINNIYIELCNLYVLVHHSTASRGASTQTDLTSQSILCCRFPGDKGRFKWPPNFGYCSLPSAKFYCLRVF
jgi:hypothetical protein